ncbi:MAG: PAM68 family protein [Cyanobacteria bacterium P01_H01_bin.15]
MPRDSLPFEPRSKKKKKSAKSDSSSVKTSKSTLGKNGKDSNRSFAKSTSSNTGVVSNRSAYSDRDKSLNVIPQAVSKRMVRRMALFCGIPTSLGIASFVVFYLLETQEILEVPPSAVVLVSLGLFGLGVAGLSYGILSASWDENRSGGWFGAGEFRVNVSRLFSSWRAARQEAIAKRES